jgi:hypothetical protein
LLLFSRLYQTIVNKHWPSHQIEAATKQKATKMRSKRLVFGSFTIYRRKAKNMHISAILSSNLLFFIKFTTFSVKNSYFFQISYFFGKIRYFQEIVAINTRLCDFHYQYKRPQLLLWWTYRLLCDHLQFY